MDSRSVVPSVLDVACGSRMFWFDHADSRAVFVDIRHESHSLPDQSSLGGKRILVIQPDIQADFTHLPFESNHFTLVVYDPPHFRRNGKKSWMGLKYGTLSVGWENMIREGFRECFRVLVPKGVLIFKWNETEIPVSYITGLSVAAPLFGHKSGKQQRTHWLTFMKPETPEPENG